MFAGLSPFVTTVPIAGTAGSPVRILGTNLTGTTGVSFNGVPAAFEVVSPFEINATVPVHAMTGRIQVMSPKGDLSTKMSFQVISH